MTSLRLIHYCDEIVENHNNVLPLIEQPCILYKEIDSTFSNSRTEILYSNTIVDLGKLFEILFLFINCINDVYILK